MCRCRKVKNMLSEKQVSKEQIEQARKLDLLSYLQQYEPYELVKVASGVYSTRSNDSLKISNGKWYRWSRGYGGVSALDYLVKVREMDFVSAVRYLCDKAGYIPPPQTCTAKPPKKKTFCLPPANANNERVICYLRARGLSPELLSMCIDMGLLYEDTRHNCVFVGFDEEKKPRYAMMRSSNSTSVFLRESEGSDKRFSFSLPRNEKKTLYVFESAIDCLSFVELQREGNRMWKPDNYLSLSGVYQSCDEFSLDTPLPLALAQFLESSPQIEKIQLCLDADETGQNAAQTLISLLKKSFDITYLPPAHGKDYNEMLMKEKGIGANIRTRNSKKRTKEEISR